MKCQDILSGDLSKINTKPYKLLINIYYAFENYKKYICGKNFKKNYQYLWNLFTSKTNWLNKNELIYILYLYIINK